MMILLIWAWSLGWELGWVAGQGLCWLGCWRLPGEAYWRENMQKMLCLSTCLQKSLVWRSVWKPDMDFDGKLTVTYDTHRSGDARTDSIKPGSASWQAVLMRIYIYIY